MRIILKGERNKPFKGKFILKTNTVVIKIEEEVPQDDIYVSITTPTIVVVVATTMTQAKPTKAMIK